MNCGIKCFFGFHEWIFRVYFGKGGYSIGYQCTVCNLWKRNRVAGAWHYHEEV